MKILIIVCLALLLASCKTNKDVPLESCNGYDMILKEFSSNFESSDSDCYIYNFDKDSMKYIDYNEFGGKTKFMDYRLNEILYYQHKLTNEFLDLPTNSKACQQKYSKQDIVKLFGDPSDYNEHYMTLTYNQCMSDKNELNLNYIQFKFDRDQRIESFIINMYQM
jgi:hypothetical protein